ncbi:MAG: 2OG-Fe(II) oxygenase [Sulfuricurvum sp.]|uniref:2OG-Fe(II) oxygenase n=1 Tax=Sulfuricurvum sp. TaxID=2025608 RepID=UPI002621A963|nr:2OG-Fe(II) oxygenase [Sulfuricurvum sp.]MDD2830030.1 2OG-Fe(II) oxygenase [Sulfuricurvum sp.]MDD4948351.1 2OG-Fe(II) oxygenase [Sulfuricurvum sp.]
MHQISNYVYAQDELLGWDIPTKRLPNPYNDFPYMVLEGVLSPAECRAITAWALSDKEAVRAELRGRALDTAIRKTDIHTLSPEHRLMYEHRFDAVRREIEEFFALSLSTPTDVQVLGYEQGGFYLKHSDDASELRNHDGDTIGYKTVAPERVLTTVLFTTSYTPHPTDTDHFSGGELLFNYLCDQYGNTITLRPEAGDMVVFLSNPYFSHEVLPVKEGFRLSLVQWHNAL